MRTNWPKRLLPKLPNCARAVILLALLAAAVPVVRLYAAIHAAPEYQGRPLGAWLRELENPDWSIRTQAERAVQHFGAAALPRVVQLLQARESFPRDQIVERISKCAWARIYLLSSFELQNCGIKACEVLGAVARPVLPDLARLLKERSGDRVVNALAAMGPDATSALTMGLLDSSGDIRVWSAYGIGRLYALEQQRKLPGVPSQPGRQSSLLTAEKRSSLSALDLRGTVTYLMEDLDHPEPRVRAAAAWALGKLGEPARTAVPRLVGATSDGQ
jgi:HEAT repeat protein